jgi:hypothetical protein
MGLTGSRHGQRTCGRYAVDGIASHDPASETALTQVLDYSEELVRRQAELLLSVILRRRREEARQASKEW